VLEKEGSRGWCLPEAVLIVRRRTTLFLGHCEYTTGVLALCYQLELQQVLDLLSQWEVADDIKKGVEATKSTMHANL
jgi:hypothetical protein